MDMHGRSLLTATDLSAEEFTGLVDLARDLRAEKRFGFGEDEHRLAGRNIALMFGKTSIVTRAAFEVAAHDEGAHVSYLGPGETELGRKESAKHTARALGRMFDGIAYCGYDQETVETLAAYAGVPVWNGLTDSWRPTQMLADVLTVTDHCPKPLSEMSLCYLGDGRSNTANSLLVTGGLLGMDLRICAPSGLRPAQAVQLSAGRLVRRSGARLTVTSDVRSAVEGVDFLYTDAWPSMEEPAGNWDARVDQLLPYQVNSTVLGATGNTGVQLLHGVPALHDWEPGTGRQLYGKRRLRSLEVTDEVFESPLSIVFDQVENQMHTIKALMVATLGRKE